MYESEINFIGLYVRNKLKELLDNGDIDECNKMILKHYEMLNKTQKEFTERFLNDLTIEENSEFIENLIDNGIPVHQPPFFGNIDIFDLTEIYSYYEKTLGLKKCKFSKKNKNNEDIILEEEMTIGELYMIRLKHQPKNKSSMRSTNLRDLTNLPTKDRSFKEYKSLYPHTPIKWGEQEVMNSHLTEDRTAIKELLNSYGVDSESEKILEENLLLGNPFNIDIDFPKDTTSKTMEVNKELFYAIGAEIVDFDDTDFLNEENPLEDEDDE